MFNPISYPLPGPGTAGTSSTEDLCSPATRRSWLRGHPCVSVIRLVCAGLTPAVLSPGLGITHSLGSHLQMQKRGPGLVSGMSVPKLLNFCTWETNVGSKPIVSHVHFWME